MSGKSSARKGASGEKELAAILMEHGYPVERGGTMSFGERPDLSGLPYIHCECKRVERLNINAAMQQAVADSMRFQDGCPTVFHRKSRSPWLVTMRLVDWLTFYQKATDGLHKTKSDKSR